MSDARKTAAMVTDDEYASAIARQLIDLGAACQKARSFTVVSSTCRARSVYDVMADQLLASLRKHFREARADG